MKQSEINQRIERLRNAFVGTEAEVRQVQANLMRAFTALGASLPRNPFVKSLPIRTIPAPPTEDQ